MLFLNLSRCTRMDALSILHVEGMIAHGKLRKLFPYLPKTENSHFSLTQIVITGVQLQETEFPLSKT